MNFEPTPTSPSTTTPTAPLPSDHSPATPTPTQRTTLPLSRIHIDPDELDRIDPDDDGITALALAIARSGLLNPITVEPNGEAYRVVAGRRRLRAVQQLGWQEVDVTITHCTPTQRAIIKLTENVTRSNLSPLEEATQIGPLLQAHDNDLNALSKIIGRSKSWIQDRIDMNAWPDTLLEAVHNKKLSLAVAKRLARVPNPEQRDYLITQAITYGCNAATAALWLRDAITAPQSDAFLPEKSALPGRTTYKTETQCTCFRCNRWTNLAQTTPARICHECVTELGQPPTLSTREHPVEPDHNPDHNPATSSAND